MRDWLRAEPLVIVRGEGAVVEDANGREYLDANSSIWTNLHGHNHPKINAAIERQLHQIAHSSALGLANEPASILAGNLIAAANPAIPGAPSQGSLTKVFYSDNGSTAMEVALKLAYEYSRRTGQSEHPRFLSMDGAYHGDTVGAVSLGHIDRFHNAYSGLLFQTDMVMAPYCYRCPFNRAKPQRADAREYRKCNWECVGKVEEKFAERLEAGQSGYSAMVVEPVMQGAAGLIAQPRGWLNRVSNIVRQHRALLIADEVLTGFGRASTPDGTNPDLFASHREGVQPDLMALAKGMTGGYLPMAATLTSQTIFDAFLGDYSEFRTFFHGHSYTGNQLGSAAAIASLNLLQASDSIADRQRLAATLRETTARLWDLPNVGDVRQEGTILGIELVKDRASRQPFAPEEQAGINVCKAMASRGVLTRPIGNVIVVMPPYCTNDGQTEEILSALVNSIRTTFGPSA
jgi:adenosylmethionine-8-amino-7-oxononanoate aminotransferase